MVAGGQNEQMSVWRRPQPPLTPGPKTAAGALAAQGAQLLDFPRCRKKPLLSPSCPLSRPLGAVTVRSAA